MRQRAERQIRRGVGATGQGDVPRIHREVSAHADVPRHRGQLRGLRQPRGAAEGVVGRAGRGVLAQRDGHAPERLHEDGLRRRDTAGGILGRGRRAHSPAHSRGRCGLVWPGLSILRHEEWCVRILYHFVSM